MIEPDSGYSKAASKQEALSNVRDGLAALSKVPAAGLSGRQQLSQLTEVLETAKSLERALSNELDQQQHHSDEAEVR